MEETGIKGLLFKIKKAITSDNKVIEMLKRASDDYEKMKLVSLIKDEATMLKVLKDGVFVIDQYYPIVCRYLSDDSIMDLVNSGVVQDSISIATMITYLSSDEAKANFIKAQKGNLAIEAEELIISYIKDDEQYALAMYYAESDWIGIENEDYKEEVISGVSDTLEACELFCRVYGKDFARPRMETLRHVFIEKPIGNYEGFCLPCQDIIAITSHHGDRDFRTALHESVHHILSRRSKTGESETGLFLSSGIGRGLNEGLTEWICEKAGYILPERARNDDYLDIDMGIFDEPDYRRGHGDYYYDLKEFVKQIELAVGEERVMRLGMGDIESNIPNCLGMSRDDAVAFLKQVDAYYSIGNKIRKYQNTIRKMKNEDEPQEDFDKSKYEEMIDDLCIEKHRLRAEIETTIFEKYFQKEFEAIKNRGYFKDEEYVKYSSLRRIMQEYSGEELADMPSLVFQREFDEILMQQAKADEITIGMFRKMCSRHDRYIVDQVYGKDFAFTMYNALDSHPKADIVTIKRVSSQDGRLHDLIIEIDGQVCGDNVIDSTAHITKDSMYREIFVNTATDGYEQLIEEFCEIRDRELEEHPETQVFIMNKTVIIGTGKNRKIYLIDSDNNHLVEVENEEVEKVLVSKELEDDGAVPEKE